MVNRIRDGQYMGRRSGSRNEVTTDDGYEKSEKKADHRGRYRDPADPGNGDHDDRRGVPVRKNALRMARWRAEMEPRGRV